MVCQNSNEGIGIWGGEKRKAKVYRRLACSPGSRWDMGSGVLLDGVHDNGAQKHHESIGLNGGDHCNKMMEVLASSMEGH